MRDRRSLYFLAFYRSNLFAVENLHPGHRSPPSLYLQSFPKLCSSVSKTLVNRVPPQAGHVL